MNNFYYFAASFKVARFDRNHWHGHTEITNCIKKEKLHEVTDWNKDEESKNAKIEIDKLTKWWSERVKQEKAGKIDPILTDNQYEKDTEMLIRLILVRQFLWT